jgi:hypothetical protein
MGAHLTTGSTAEDVKAELEALGAAYHKYGPIAVDEGIDGGLTEEILIELGVTSSLHKRKLLKAIAAFVESTGGGGGSTSLQTE